MTSLPASCGSCGIHSCTFNAEISLCRVPLTGEAWLLDEMWPEFDTYLGQKKIDNALGFVPWHNSLLPLRSYHWSALTNRRILAVPGVTFQRSLAMRGSRLNGGRRQAIQEQFDRLHASAFAKKLPYNVGRLVIWQNFLPFLLQDKTLGGREYEILTWRSPRHVLQQTLDLAASHYPESSTLRDFRSDPGLAEAERLAFERASRIVTPHRELARLYPEKTLLLDWAWPNPNANISRGSKIAFLGPAVGRRGAYVVRAAMQKLGRPLVVLGRNLEQPDFWKGLNIEERVLGPECLRDVGLLLSPSITDFKPRFLMRALRSGIPVIATRACGLPVTEGLHFADPLDAFALAQKIEELQGLPR